MWFITFLAKNLLKRKVRSLLTCIGIAIAVGTMIVLVGIADGFERATIDAFERRDNDIIVIEKDVLNHLDSDIDQQILRQVERMPKVKMVGPALLELVGFPIGGSVLPVTLQGWRPGSFQFDDLDVKAGRNIRPGDGRVAMLGETIARPLKKKVGDMVDVEGEPFEVVGIFESFTNFENTSLIVPLEQLQQVMVRPGRITGFSVVLRESAKDEESVKAVCQAINNLKYEYDRPARLAAKATLEYVKEATHIRAAKSMAWVTSLIAVVVGTIGILNTMAMSVVERVHEIGVLRAIGWRKSRVIKMIVCESLLLSLLGAMLGTAGALGVVRWLGSLPAAADIVPPNIAPVVLAEGILMAAFLGLLGGIYPALHAAALLPSEGLRHE